MILKQFVANKVPEAAVSCQEHHDRKQQKVQAQDRIALVHFQFHYPLWLDYIVIPVDNKEVIAL